MQAGWQTEEPFFSGSPCCVEKQQTPEEDRKGLEKRGSHPSLLYILTASCFFFIIAIMVYCNVLLIIPSPKIKRFYEGKDCIILSINRPRDIAQCLTHNRDHGYSNCSHSQ